MALMEAVEDVAFNLYIYNVHNNVTGMVNICTHAFSSYKVFNSSFQINRISTGSLYMSKN